MVDIDAALVVSGKPALAVAVVRTFVVVVVARMFVAAAEVVHTSAAVVAGVVARMFAGSSPPGEQNLLGMSSK